MSNVAVIRRELSDAELIDRLDRIEHHLARLAADPKVTTLEPWVSKKEGRRPGRRPTISGSQRGRWSGA